LLLVKNNFEPTFCGKKEQPFRHNSVRVFGFGSKRPRQFLLPATSEAASQLALLPSGYQFRVQSHQCSFARFVVRQNIFFLLEATHRKPKNQNRKSLKHNDLKIILKMLFLK
jgi:hypothetical protein